MSRIHEAFLDIGEFKVYSSTDATFRALHAVQEVFEQASSTREALEDLLAALKYVADRRPTSIMLFNVMKRMLDYIESGMRMGASKSEVAKMVEEGVGAMRREIENAISLAATLGARRVRENASLLTCSYSRVVKMLFSRLKSEGKRVRAFVTESRPGGEGIRLAQELSEMGIETELIVDSSVRHFMKEMDMVVTGAEAIAANGAVVNKVGTSLIALAANEARVRTFVLTTTHKFSAETIFGELVKLPVMRDVSLLPGLEKRRDLNVCYPLFDVTPPRYVDAIITEKGVVAPEAVILLVRELHGWPTEVHDLISRLEKLVEVVGG
ncbi:MAG: hypothetical protein QW407_00195 [Thermofilaceae archaeon]